MTTKKRKGTRKTHKRTRTANDYGRIELPRGKTANERAKERVPAPTFNGRPFDVAEYDRILACGLSFGLGARGNQVCIEAAICQTLGLPHGDDPGCVDQTVRAFKISLNDSNWSSPEARARGLRDLGLAQLGSKGVINSREFTKRLAEKTIRVLIPTLFREVFPNNKECLDAADLCEKEGTESAAHSASSAAHSAAHSAAYSASSAAYSAAYWAAYSAADSAGSAADSAGSAAYSAASSAAHSAYSAASSAGSAAYSAAYWAAYSAYSAASSARSAAYSDKYLILSAKLALDVLRDLKSPGIQLLAK